MLGLSRRIGWSVRLTRTALEVVVLVGGWLLGGAVGVGTVVIALTIGPVIQFMSRITGEEKTLCHRHSGVLCEEAVTGSR
jgi:uncharacterized membrane protein YczE